MWLWGLLPAASARPTWQVHSRKSILLLVACCIYLLRLILDRCTVEKSIFFENLYLLRSTWQVHRKQHIVFCPVYLPSTCNWIHPPCWSLFSDLCLKEHPHIIKQIFLGQIFPVKAKCEIFFQLNLWTRLPWHMDSFPSPSWRVIACTRRLGTYIQTYNHLGKNIWALT